MNSAMFCLRILISGVKLNYKYLCTLSVGLLLSVLLAVYNIIMVVLESMNLLVLLLICCYFLPFCPRSLISDSDIV